VGELLVRGQDKIVLMSEIPESRQMRSRNLLFLMLFSLLTGNAAQPKLILVISIDQFPYEYITRFRSSFAPDGFALLLQQGATFANTTYKHANTSTGPGHAVILTGAYGSVNGIISNSWFDTASGREVYCVEDSASPLVGGTGEGRSPVNLLAPTFGDQLRLHTGFRSKVVSLAHKDRAAILLGGKFPNLAAWLEDSMFVSSRYYTDTLPSWLAAFNASRPVTGYFGQVWNRLLPDSVYAMQDDDDVPYEDGGNGLGRAFPHPITGSDRARLTGSYYSAFLSSPFANDLLLRLARQAVTAEQLGRRGVPDLLTLGLSANDYVGHAFGPHSHEVLDMTLRTDRALAGFFRFLDRELGLKNCLIALTSDHAVSPIPGYITHHAHRTPFLTVERDTLVTMVERVLQVRYGQHPGGGNWILAAHAGGLYLDRKSLARVGADLEDACAVVVSALSSAQGVLTIFTRERIERSAPVSTLDLRLRNSYLPRRSPDVIPVPTPLVAGGHDEAGTSHGSPYEADAHVPLIIAGPGIRPGTYFTETSPADLAPTLSALTGVGFPTARQGRVLAEAISVK
jgi:predicted AlkP superfamily pyrophosphatase or phosphodiesterase